MGPIIEQVDPEREREGREGGGGGGGQEQGGRERARGGEGRRGMVNATHQTHYHVYVETETHLFPSWTHPAMSLMGMCNRFTLVLV